MKPRNHFSILAVAAAFAAASGSASYADTQTSEMTAFAPYPLIVESNGQSYTKLQNIGIATIQAHIRYDTEIGGRIKSWTVTPSITTGYGFEWDVPGMDAYKESKSYSLQDRPKLVDRTIPIQFPASKLAERAVSMCNQLASTLRTQGKTNEDIFGQDRDVEFLVGLDFKVDATGAGSSGGVGSPTAIQPRFPTKVVCQNSGPFRLQVLAATVQLQEVATANGACMVKLTTEISTNLPGATVKFRYVDKSGKKSKVFTAKTAANKIAVVKQDWEIPNKAGAEIGWMFIEGVSPKFQSNSAGYNMNCKDGVGGVASQAPLVEKATMKLQEIATIGECKVKLTTEIKATKPGATFKYRYVHSSGQKSKTFSVQTPANKIAVVNMEWDIPNTAGREVGWMQIEGVVGVFKSNRARYAMNCKGPLGESQ